jgi:hypothetical protein
VGTRGKTVAFNGLVYLPISRGKNPLGRQLQPPGCG